MLTSILTTLLADFVCAIIVVFGFKRLSRPYRVLGWYQILSALAEIAGFILIKIKIPNLFLFSVYGLVAFILLQLFCFLNLAKNRLSLITILPISLVWIAESAYRGISVFPSYFFLLQSVVLIIAYFSVLYQSSLTTKERLTKNPDFFSGLAVVIFYGCMTHYLIFSLNSATLGLNTRDLETLGLFTIIYSNLKAVLLGAGFILEIQKYKNQPIKTS